MNIVQRAKLSGILALALFLPLAWVLALSSAAAPLVQSAGVYGCVGYAAAIAAISAWLIVAFVAELRKR